MKTTVDHSHRQTLINYLFFGIAASIFTLSIFFAVYQSNLPLTISKDFTHKATSRLNKPLATNTITETYAINLKEMMSDAAEAPLSVEPWMTEPFAVSAPAKTASYAEQAILVEEWMTDLDSYTMLPAVEMEEAALSIESWMLDASEWNILNANSIYADNTFATEQLNIEEWMLDLNAYSTLPLTDSYEEPSLTIESWMLNTSEWVLLKQADLITTHAEEPLTIEAWMLSLETWPSVLNDEQFAEAPLRVEDWMLDASTWMTSSH